MGRDIHLILTKYDKEDRFYKEIALYRKRDIKDTHDYIFDTEKQEIVEVPAEPWVKVSIYDGRDYEMFDAIQLKEEDNYGYFPAGCLDFSSLEPELRDRMKAWSEAVGTYGFCEFSFADMKAYVALHPEVKDYEAEWEEGEEIPKKINPIRNLYNSIVSYLSFADIDYAWGITFESSYKVLCFFDC